MSLTKKKSQKSVKLNEGQKEALTELRAGFNSDSAFAAYLKMDRVTLIRIMQLGSGSEGNIKKLIRKLDKI